MSTRHIVLLSVVALSLFACGSQAPAAGSGNAASGQKLFQEATLGTTYVSGCKACHPLEPGKTGAGPSLAGVATTAAAVVKDPAYRGQAKTDAEFLRESILDPGTYVAKGFQDGVMPKTYKAALTESQINDLVAYLGTLK